MANINCQIKTGGDEKEESMERGERKLVDM